MEYRPNVLKTFYLIILTAIVIASIGVRCTNRKPLLDIGVSTPSQRIVIKNNTGDVHVTIRRNDTTYVKNFLGDTIYYHYTKDSL